MTTNANPCPSRYTGILSSYTYRCDLGKGHHYPRHVDHDGVMTWEDRHADPAPVTDPALESIRARLEDDKAQYSFAAGYDQAIRDREYLLSLLDAQ